MEKKLIELMATLFKTDPAKVTLTSGPGDIAAWDSAGHMTLVMELEEKFGVQFDDDKVVELTSVGAILDALIKLKPEV